MRLVDPEQLEHMRHVDPEQQDGPEAEKPNHACT